jgi:hypothetical protein
MGKVEGYVACRGICKLFKSSVETKGFNIVSSYPHPLYTCRGRVSRTWSCNNAMSVALVFRACYILLKPFASLKS